MFHHGLCYTRHATRRILRRSRGMLFAQVLPAETQRKRVKRVVRRRAQSVVPSYVPRERRSMLKAFAKIATHRYKTRPDVAPRSAGPAASAAPRFCPHQRQTGMPATFARGPARSIPFASIHHLFGLHLFRYMMAMRVLLIQASNLQP